MANEARGHHYVSDFYLRGFARKVSKSIHRLYCCDIEQRRFFAPSTKSVCKIRDFNRINLPGHKPDALETAYSELEGQFAQAIHNVAGKRVFEGDDKIKILNLLGLFFTRTPWMRENIRKTEEQIQKLKMSFYASTPQHWEGFMRRMEADGKGMDNPPSYWDVKQFIDDDQYDIHFNNEFHIAIEMQQFEACLPTLFHRKWRLWITNDETGHFITSNRPALLLWHDEDKVPMMLRHSPGHARKYTRVLFPLTKYLLLEGNFDGDEGVEEADVGTVAGANTLVIENCHGQVFSFAKKFPYISPLAHVMHDDKILEALELYQQMKQALKSYDEA